MTVVGHLTEAGTQGLLRACAAFYDPRKIVVPLDTHEDSKRIAKLKYPADSRPQVFIGVFAPSAGRTAGLEAGRLAGLWRKNICVNKVCAAPVTNPLRLAETAREFIEKNPH
jgi:hypothetical protein